MSSAVVSNQDEHIAVQGHQQDFEAQVDDNDNENEEIDNDDNEDEDNPDQHIMVFQQEFFEEENHVHHDDGHERVPLLVIPENAFDDDRIDNRIPVLMVPENAYEENRMENNMVHVLMVPENANEENRIENMEQEVPENQIRRELNEDYDAEANENANQGNIDEDQRTLSFDETSSSSSSEDDDDGYKYYINQASDRNKTYKKIKSSNLSKDINSNQNSGKKETKSFIKQHCAHSICTRNCSKGFDPNQPSTSKGGNCFNCPCNTFDSECKENENNSKAELKSKDVKYNDFSSEDSANIKKTVKSYLDNGIQGPMTRNRKRALDQDIKKKEFFYSSIEVGNPKRHKISEEKNMPSTSTNCASKKLQPKQEIMDSETTNSIDQNVEKRDKMKNNKISRISSQKDCTEQDKQKTKGHKKHNHKKCKYRRCERLCHKKGPLTRSKSIKQNDYNTVSQGTMATSADIRRTLRKQRSCSVRCKRRGNVGCGSLQCRSYNHISARQLHKKPRQEKPNVEVQNKSTSTSDPLMEDDPVQVLRLESRTLISLTIVQCGISDIVFDHLENLSYVEIQACRIFKKFQLNHCPSLKKFDVSECPKMTLENTASQILSLPSPKKLLVTFEPCMQNYCPAYAEKIIFSKALFDHSIILFHDYTNYIYDTMPANIKENILQWMELVQNVYQRPKCLAFYKYVQGKQKKRKNKDKLNLEELSNRTRYPYGHSLRRITGMYLMPPSRNPNSPSEGRYQILTNDQMFATCLELKSWDDGFPFPHCLESAEDTVLLNLLESEFTEENLKMKTKMISFYIPVIEDDLEEFDDDEDST
ncbi:f-box only protein 38 [Caerostris extrusa]|uniref:F-box only protein 38 n=1 Tax=Caerostris extrusa TaxID=172846 RepID=A0AAV4R0F9_CAEEX|nr:f-box only protein 38 [Caerostris extrusa]